MMIALSKCTADMSEYEKGSSFVDGALREIQLNKIVILLDSILDNLEEYMDILGVTTDDDDFEDSDI